MSEQAAILIEKLSKRYPGSSVLALDQLSLVVQPGEIYGFLGPNGAGKTTTIRTLLNFIRPTAGRAAILGMDVRSKATELHRLLGYLAGDIALYPKLNGREFLAFMAELQPPRHSGYIDTLVERFQLKLDVQISDLSKGNRQKLGLVQAFMHEPEVLILDEPTDGLDPLMQETFFEVVEESKNRGCTVFISSHNLAEVQKMCERIGFIRDGRLVAEQAVSELSQSLGQTFRIGFRGSPPLDALASLAGVAVTGHGEGEVTVKVTGDLSPLLSLLSSQDVTTIERIEVTLEDEFLKLYRGEEQ